MNSSKRTTSSTTINAVDTRLRKILDALCVPGEEDCCGSVPTVEEAMTSRIGANPEDPTESEKDDGDDGDI